MLSGCVLVIFLIRTIARQNLSTTHGTLFSVAADNMKLAFDNSTICAGMLVRAPIVVFLAVANSLNFFAADNIGSLKLSGLNLLRPSLYHPNTVVDDKLLAHGV